MGPTVTLGKTREWVLRSCDWKPEAGTTILRGLDDTVDRLVIALTVPRQKYEIGIQEGSGLCKKIKLTQCIQNWRNWTRKEILEATGYNFHLWIFQTMICSLQKCLLSLMTVHISVANAHGDKPQTILNWAQLQNSSSFSPRTTPSSVPPFDPPSNPSLSDFLSPGDSTLPPLSTSTRPTSIQPIKFPSSRTSLSHPM